MCTKWKKIAVTQVARIDRTSNFTVKNTADAKAISAENGATPRDCAADARNIHAELRVSIISNCGIVADEGKPVMQQTCISPKRSKSNLQLNR